VNDGRVAHSIDRVPPADSCDGWNGCWCHVENLLDNLGGSAGNHIALPLTVTKTVASIMVPKVPAMLRIRTAHFARTLAIAQCKR
jgi:hypothetical protein